MLQGVVDNLTGPLITQAARDGDPTARELLAEIGHWLGIGIANLAAAFDPGTFVIGGGVSAAGDLLLASARETFKRHLAGRGYRPEARIVAARLGNDAGLIHRFTPSGKLDRSLAVPVKKPAKCPLADPLRPAAPPVASGARLVASGTPTAGSQRRAPSSSSPSLPGSRETSSPKPPTDIAMAVSVQ